MPEPTARDVGEFGLIAAVVGRLGSSPAVLLGPGDDAAVVAVPDSRVVVTTDLLVEGVHFRRDWSSAYDVGRKAAAANLADVAAMGATGTALVVGLGLPADTGLAWVLELADGLRDEAAEVGAVVVGGDTVRADHVLVSVTALGDLGGLSPVTRAGARPGQSVVAAGRLGWSAAGLRLLAAGDRDGPLVQAHQRPTPPYAAGPLLARAGATAMCDVSDGLVADLGHIADASGVLVDLDSRLLLDDRVDRQDVLTGGEDHALVAVLPAGASLPAGCRIIGSTRAGSGVRLDGAPVGGGWQHFS